MKTSKSAVFLFELMIIILVFVLAAAICTQIFAAAFKMSTESRELTMSSINAQTIAEQFKAGDSDIQPLYFDSGWETAGMTVAEYRVELDELSGTAPMREAYVKVFKIGKDEAIYTLHVKRFAG